METTENIILIFLVINTIFVFRHKLWKKSISTPTIIITSDICFTLYTHGLYNSMLGTFGLVITGLVANSAFREEELCWKKKQK